MTDLLTAKTLIDRFFQTEVVTDILETVYEFCQDYGADKLSYHFAPLLQSVTSPHSTIFAWGYCQEWVALYDRREVKISDPIPREIMRAGHMMTWTEAASKSNFSEAERDFLEMARHFGLINGWSMPLWGPKVQNAYAAIGFPTTDLPSKSEMVVLRMTLQAAHERICECVRMSIDAPSLSNRELEVLTWVAQGKSNSDIASILTISPDTVATYIRRIFAKLNCHDRIGATVKALQLRLISL